MTDDATTRWVTVIKKGLASLMMASVFFPFIADAKTARCVVKQHGSTSYSGKCEFGKHRDGTFWIRKQSGTIHPKFPVILPSIHQIAVYVISPGKAEVRGLTINGNNSRWGSAVRSKKDPACWIGSDFEICAY